MTSRDLALKIRIQVCIDFTPRIARISHAHPLPSIAYFCNEMGTLHNRINGTVVPSLHVTSHSKYINQMPPPKSLADWQYEVSMSGNSHPHSDAGYAKALTNQGYGLETTVADLVGKSIDHDRIAL